jgi:hypothetical protein
LDKKTAKDMKEIAEVILKSKNINYTDWLYEKHLEVLLSNSSSIKENLCNSEEKKKIN